MKKAVKGLIIAASVASVIGIGAVSFAAWSGSGNEPVKVEGDTGIINTLGELTVTPNSSLDALYPVDQEGESYTTYWKFTVSSDITGTQTVTYKIKGTLAKGTADDSTDVSESAKLYCTTTQPEGDEVAGAIAIPLGEDATATEITGLSNGGDVYVYLVAEGTDAMKAKITLTFIAE